MAVGMRKNDYIYDTQVVVAFDLLKVPADDIQLIFHFSISGRQRMDQLLPAECRQ
jgi:hypothetical protein